jgi:hypothetical protein
VAGVAGGNVLVLLVGGDVLVVVVLVVVVLVGVVVVVVGEVDGVVLVLGDVAVMPDGSGSEVHATSVSPTAQAITIRPIPANLAVPVARGVVGISAVWRSSIDVRLMCGLRRCRSPEFRAVSDENRKLDCGRAVDVQPSLRISGVVPRKSGLGGRDRAELGRSVKVAPWPSISP